MALATCAAIPDGDQDFPGLIAELATLGIAAEAVVWDDADVDWPRYDLVLPRATWDYAERLDAFLDWARSVPRVLNPVPLLEWNTDKRRYLTDLAAAGVPVVSTSFVEPGQAIESPAGPFVVKPSISAGGRRSARFEPDDIGAAQSLVRRIHADGGTAMIQPHLGDADEVGLVYLEGLFSHAVRRRVQLPDAGEREVLYLDEELGPAEAAEAEQRIAEAALACAGTDLLYGRIDLMAGVVLELEVTEPSLYLTYDEDATTRFARAIAARV